jgi:hypothetical protein
VPLLFELHLQLLEQVSSSQIFLQWLGSFIKWGTVVEMLVLDCFIPELILGIVRRSCYLGTSPDYGWVMLSYQLQLLWLVVNYFFLITKHSLGPIGDSPLLDQTSSKEQLKRLLFM